MSLENVEDTVKVIVVGNGEVGKSSLVRRFCKGDFTNEYKKTIGADFLEKEIFVKSTDESVRMFLWDTAGQEVFDALTSTYYRGAGACVLAFSTVDRDSFLAVKGWKDKVEKQCGAGNVVMALIQTKIDLIDQAKVDNNEAEELAKQLGVKFFRTSTKENYNIDPVFEYLAESYLAKDTKSKAPEAAAISMGGAKEAPKDEDKKPEKSKSDAAAKVKLDGPSTQHATKKKRICVIL